MTFTRDDLLKLLNLIDLTVDDEIDCTEFLHRAASFVEQYEPGRPLPPGHEDVVRHLKICPECLEEFRHLYQALRAERSAHP